MPSRTQRLDQFLKPNTLRIAGCHSLNIVSSTADDVIPTPAGQEVSFREWVVEKGRSILGFHLALKRALRSLSGRRLSTSRAGGGWYEQTRQTETHASTRPKSKLGLPDLDHSKSAVLDSLRSPESKRGYRHAIDEFIQRYCSEPRLSFHKVVVTRFSIFLENRGLAAATINGRLAAVRRFSGRTHLHGT
jgi:hypothetical protein